MSNHSNAKYAFYYLLSLAALIFVAISVGLIVFGIIDKSIADVLVNYGTSDDGALKFAISALLIATPIFYVTVHLINRGLKKGELDKESGIRRWLTYFILLVSSLVLLGVFIGVINNFLSGELTASFILKALAMFVISGTIFAYYFYEVKREKFSGKIIVLRIFFYASLALVLAAFISAWFFIESPTVARNRRLDQNVISNMGVIESAVNTYWNNHGILPDTLAQVKAEPGVFLSENSLIDPANKQPIEYHKTATSTFEFCATFRTDNHVENQYASPDAKVHAIGHQCVSGTIFNPRAVPVTTIVR